NNGIGFLFPGVLLSLLRLFEVKEAIDGQVWDQWQSEGPIALLLWLRQPLQPQPDLLAGGAVINPEAFTRGRAILSEYFSFEVGWEKLFRIPLVHLVQGEFFEQERETAMEPAHHQFD